MKYRNQLRIAGLLVAASLFTGAPQGLVSTAFAEDAKPAGAVTVPRTLVPEPAANGAPLIADPAVKDAIKAAPPQLAAGAPAAAPAPPVVPRSGRAHV